MFLSGLVAALYALHRRGIIEVRIPRTCRCLCFRGYLSPEEKAEFKRQEALAKQRELTRELTIRVAAKPSVHGFPLEDSFFSEQEGVTKADSKAKMAVRENEEAAEVDDGDESLKKKKVTLGQDGAPDELDTSTKQLAELRKSPAAIEDRDSNTLTNTAFDFFEYNNPNFGLKMPGEVVAYMRDGDRSGACSEGISLPVTDKSQALAGLRSDQSQPAGGSTSRSGRGMSELEMSPGSKLERDDLQSPHQTTSQQ